MILKCKAWLYRLTGIYLAHKEENEYVDSEDFWIKFCKLTINEDLGYRNIYGILVGSWQFDNGFYREWKPRGKYGISN